MRLPYKKSEIGNYRPLIKIQLCSVTEDMEIPVWFLLDSGSDITIVDIQLADLLGVDITKAHHSPVTGIGNGKMEGYEAKVKIIFDNNPQIAKVLFADLQGKYSILGHVGFFEFYRVLFDTRDRVFEIIPNWRPK